MSGTLAKEKYSFKSLFVAAILILAGFLSPSNGVDDLVLAGKSSLLLFPLVVIAVVIICQVIILALRKSSSRNNQL